MDSYTANSNDDTEERSPDLFPPCNLSYLKWPFGIAGDHSTLFGSKRVAVVLQGIYRFH